MNTVTLHPRRKLWLLWRCMDWALFIALVLAATWLAMDWQQGYSYKSFGKYLKDEYTWRIKCQEGRTQ